ncbi:MAG: hypothetical protein ACJ71U_15820 [Terriglobales bacterium]
MRQIPREDDSAYKGTIELAGVHFRRMDKTMVQMAGPQFMKQAREPFAMEVETANPLPKTPRNTSAILIVNGEKILDTWMVLPNKLIAFFPDSRKIRESNSVAAAWTGAEATSQTRKPLTFRRQDVKIE